LCPGIRGHAHQPQDQQEQQDQKHPEEVPDRVPPLRGLRLWCCRPGSVPRSARWASGPRWRCLVSARAGRRVGRAALWRVWCRPCGVWHYAGALGLRLLALAPVQPVQILVTARRHIAKVPGRLRREPSVEWGCVGVPSAMKQQKPQILAGFFPDFLPREAHHVA
jgi:hypothetical protein